MTSNNRFELDGPMDVHDVAHVRRLVERLCRRQLATEDGVSRLAMATHELLENAVKFSVDGEASLRVEVKPNAEVSIVTRNRASKADLADLSRLAKDLHAAADPMKFYLELMRRTPSQVRGGLGIGRVAAEAELRIELDVEGDIVQVRAEGNFAA
jgi:anti-sigma regulatory factor (Ser/Thr protein kinase)